MCLVCLFVYSMSAMRCTLAKIKIIKYPLKKKQQRKNFCWQIVNNEKYYGVFGTEL